MDKQTDQAMVKRIVSKKCNIDGMRRSGQWIPDCFVGCEPDAAQIGDGYFLYCRIFDDVGLVIPIQKRIIK